MLNIHDLEKRWKIYKIKSYLPYTIIILICFILITWMISIFYYIPYKKTITTNTHTVKKPLHTVKKTIITKTDNKQQNYPITLQKPLEPNKQPEALQPSMGFMQNMHYQTSKTKPKIHQPKQKIINNIPTEVTQDLKSVKVRPKKKQVAVRIERKETQNDIFEIINRFKKNNNPALSLFVAKKYYELGNYEQSYNYALITNQINSNIEASWIIFSKSLVKLHKKDKAINTLQEYIKVSHSSNAEILLNEIKAGKFK